MMCAVRRSNDDVWARLQINVVQSGLCTHCGTCAGLSNETLRMQETKNGPLPTPAAAGAVTLPQIAYEACPGKGIDYPTLNRALFGDEPASWLIGAYRRLSIGYATDPHVRRRAASGGVISSTLVYLLETGRIDGAVVVRQGTPRPWQAQPIIARTAADILAASQSVYAPVPVNTVLDRMATFHGTLAYVGLPDQVASLRALQLAGHPAATRVRYVLGPYVGTNMYFSAIESYLRANGVSSLDEVAELRYREGEWPGYLMIRTRDGQVLKAEKFYYNYLIPFYITRSTLLSVDFTSELTDISVGDAWHPRYESQGGGFSVVVARTQAGDDILMEMQDRGILHLEETDLNDALSMHGHMLDFKKRGAFVRLQWRAAQGKPVPAYGYRPSSIPASRKMVELVISLLFAACGTSTARWLAEKVPIRLLGPLFNTLRKTWKSLSKPTKRKGLLETAFVTTDSGAGHSLSQAQNGAVSTAVSRTREEIKHWLRPDWSFADVGAHWDATEDYDDINAETYSYFRRFVDGLRLSNLPDNGRVLDICARTGNGTLYFHQHGKVASAVCADVSAAMGEICQLRLREGGVEDFAWLQIFDYALPLPSEEFDTVLCFETVEHFPHPEQMLFELARVTKPGGTLILTTPSLLWEPIHALAAITGLHHSEGPHRFLPYRRLMRMVHGAGFTIVENETTVLVPGGPDVLVSIGEWIEARTRHSLMPLLGLRRVLVCRKL